MTKARPARAAEAAPRTAKPARALRTPGGLSLRLDVRAAVVTAGLFLLACAAGVLLIGSGDFDIAVTDVIKTLFGGGTTAQEFIVNDLRLPRVLVGLLVGAALGIAGAVFQTVTRNPLGSPDMLGFSHGATAGALCAIVLLHGGPMATAAGALIGAVVTGIAVYTLAWKRGVHGYRLVLVGIGGSAVLVAINGYLLTKAQIADAARAVLWMTGSLNGRDWAQVWPLLAACAVLVPLTVGYGRQLRMLEMGDDTAYALGIRAERVRLVTLVAATLLVAVATAAAGPVAFVALTAPQLARRLTKAPGPNLLPSACMGAVILLVADWASQRLFGADQLPVGVLTGMLGGGYLLWLLAAERKAGRI
ncbi:FecCD family ABC transporter permease [Streptomyces boninensis]|uniref:FecCD family ABC transporter permease n=1 Tax=Streptomyces boninensis TaxID=2039455 RepID=UPI003B214A59